MFPQLRQLNLGEFSEFVAEKARFVLPSDPFQDRRLFAQIGLIRDRKKAECGRENEMRGREKEICVHGNGLFARRNELFVLRSELFVRGNELFVLRNEIFARGNEFRGRGNRFLNGKIKYEN